MGYKVLISIKRHVLSILMIACLAGCMGGGGSGDDSSESSNSGNVKAANFDPLSNDTILTAIYSNIRTPNGFYAEAPKDPSNFYTISHVKNMSIMSLGSITPDTPLYELCTDDFTEALNWSELDSVNSNNYMPLVDNSDNNMFYEFVRVNPSAPNLVKLSRIYKCSFLDRSNIDLLNPSNMIGYYNDTSNDVSNFKLLIEYLWFFSINNNFGHAVLVSTPSQSDMNFIHTLIEARMTQNGSPSSNCDKIDIIESIYEANKISGEITLQESIINTIYSKYQNGNTEICNE